MIKNVKNMMGIVNPKRPIYDVLIRYGSGEPVLFAYFKGKEVLGPFIPNGRIVVHMSEQKMAERFAKDENFTLGKIIIK